MVEVAREHKYVREFRKIIEIYSEIDNEDAFSKRIILDSKLNIQRFGLSIEDIKVLVKDIFDFFSGLGEKKIQELSQNLQICPKILRKDCIEEGKKHFYHLCRSKPTISIDFLPHPFELEEKRKNQFYKKLNWFGKLDPDFWKHVCEFFGISIHGSSEAIKHLCRIYPKLTQTYSYIAEVLLDQRSHGEIFFTPNRHNKQHYSWFPYVEVEEPRAVIRTFPL